MKVENMTSADYKTLKLLADKKELIYTNKEMEQNAYGWAFARNGEPYILEDVATINDIMKRYSSIFVRFMSFTEDGRIRYECKWSDYYTGVGYTEIKLLKHGIPLGNHHESSITEFKNEFLNSSGNLRRL